MALSERIRRGRYGATYQIVPLSEWLESGYNVKSGYTYYGKECKVAFMKDFPKSRELSDFIIILDLSNDKLGVLKIHMSECEHQSAENQRWDLISSIIGRIQTFFDHDRSMPKESQVDLLSALHGSGIEVSEILPPCADDLEFLWTSIGSGNPPSLCLAEIEGRSGIPNLSIPCIYKSFVIEDVITACGEQGVDVYTLKGERIPLEVLQEDVLYQGASIRELPQWHRRGADEPISLRNQAKFLSKSNEGCNLLSEDGEILLSKFYKEITQLKGPLSFAGFDEAGECDLYAEDYSPIATIKGSSIIMDPYSDEHYIVYVDEGYYVLYSDKLYKSEIYQHICCTSKGIGFFKHGICHFFSNDGILIFSKILNSIEDVNPARDLQHYVMLARDHRGQFFINYYGEKVSSYFVGEKVEEVPDSDGIYLVQHNSQVLLIDGYGHTILGPFEGMKKTGSSWLVKDGNGVSLLDAKNQCLTDPYDSIDRCGDNWLVGKDNQYTLINIEGGMVDGPYDIFEGWRNDDLALVGIQGKYGILSMDEGIVSPCNDDYEEALDLIELLEGYYMF